MTPEDKELVDRLKRTIEGAKETIATAANINAERFEAAAAIERLSAEVERQVEELSLLQTQMRNENEALRAQIAEAQPVAWMDKRGAMCLFSTRKHCETDVPLYLHPADAKDAERYRWLRKEHAINDPMAAVVWKRNYDRRSSGWVNTTCAKSLDAAIDAAIKGGA